VKAGIDTRVEIEVLTAEDRRLEAVAMRLRTREGVPLDLLPTPDPLPSLIEEGWVVVENDHVRLTREGKALADPIAGMLV
jgi:coproporphyrinogen III oxidase-like Fe-S oxidoreductase